MAEKYVTIWSHVKVNRSACCAGIGSALVKAVPGIVAP
jgi:hypothetical protein